MYKIRVLQVETANNVQIVYTAIVGAVMLAAFLEWFLWLAAFMYCLVKVYQKAEHWSVKLLAVLVAIVFSALRYVFTAISLDIRTKTMRLD